MWNWGDTAALGVYLGITDAGGIAGRVAGHPDAWRLMKPITGLFARSGHELAPGRPGALPATLAATDYDRLARQGDDRPGLLSEDLYRRLAESGRADDMLPPEAFDRHFGEFLRRFGGTVRAALFGLGVRKEIISLENPAIRDAVEEVARLPCRSFEGTGDARRGHFSASLSRYVQSLIERHWDEDVGLASRAQALEILDHLSAYPGYYRHVEKERKVEAAQTLVAAMSALRMARAGDRETTDLVVALGILLFNVFPSPGIVRYLAANSPAGDNRSLIYEHNALLAINFLLMGRRAAAAEYCRRAREAAPGADLKAYAYVLDGCIALEGRDYPKATAALEKAMEIAEGRGLRSLAGFYLGIVRYEVGEVGLAAGCFREAKAGAEGEADAMAACNNLGICHMVLGDVGSALRSFEEAYAMGTYSGRGLVKAGRATAAGSAGIVYLSMREPELAAEHFARALRASRETCNARSIANQLMNLGLAHKAMGEYADASTHFVSALNYAYTIDYIEGVLYTREQVRQALALQGKHDEEDRIYRSLARRHPGIRRLLTRR
ncbi:MAG TPA: tetratricopeptide repeat protein [Methanocella sp.]|nr:tetratricopeptide repeat protein [Methanocella sp.]